MGILYTDSNFGPSYENGTTLQWEMSWSRQSPAGHDRFLFPGGRPEAEAQAAAAAAAPNLTAWAAQLPPGGAAWLNSQPASARTGIFNAAKMFHEIVTG